MTIFLCLDDNNGMLFNRRRQSRDREVIRDALDIVGNGELHVEPYSCELFQQVGFTFCVDRQPYENASFEAYIFEETMKFRKNLPKINEFVIYRWGRIYPADRFFDINLPQEGFRLVETVTFQGYSHPNITREIYRRDDAFFAELQRKQKQKQAERKKQAKQTEAE